MAPTAQDFDGWYADLADSPRRAELQQGTLGLPPHVESTSLLPWAGIAELVTGLAAGEDDTVLDLACGRGGYGLEVARRCGASLAGVDFSRVAVARARELASTAFPDVRARFEIGELTATGLRDGSVDAVMCVDAMQFAEPHRDGLAECLRVLAPGGRFVLTGWQAHDAADTSVPARLGFDLGAAVEDAGFTAVHARHMSSWQETEREMWQRAVACDPDGDPAVESLRTEGASVLTWLDRARRMFVTARRPAV